MNVKNLTLFSGLLGFVVVALGAWTRLADAGLGCPDWPGCYGFATIPVNPEDIEIANSRYPDTPYEVAKAIPEVVHRYFAATLGLFIIGIFLAVRKNPECPKSMNLLALFLVFWVARYIWLFNGQFEALAASGYHTSNVWILNDGYCLASVFQNERHRESFKNALEF